MSDACTLQRCLSYVETQLENRGKTPRAPVAPTITISRLTGSGGIPIAESLAAYLQQHRPSQPAPWTVFHRTLVERVLSEHNLPAKMAEYIPEDRVSYIQDTMEELLGLHPSSASLVTQVTHTILGLSELGNSIIIGRGANIILAQCPTAFHVRFVSALERRIQRVQADKGISEAEARDFIRREDSGRERYVRTNFDADIADPLGYHLVLNTEWLTVEQAAELIGLAVLRKFPLN
ncbi:MAG: cytidylate kinase-like family protein [Verrucomicrobiales bacterium]|nr:cytidylate kinase-like family protein [Verrucomicrobiales bacterium]